MMVAVVLRWCSPKGAGGLVLIQAEHERSTRSFLMPVDSCSQQGA
jgi:hypothetical protein